MKSHDQQQQAYARKAEQAGASDGPLGTHPVETGVGAVAGGVIGGAVAGTAAGPLGTAVGAVAGAVLGAAAGKGIAVVVDPEAEERYWRENYKSRPYYDSTYAYDDYGPAYGYGVSSYQRHAGRSFDEVESDLHRDWGSARGSSRLDWDAARPAMRDAWTRVHEARHAAPGSADSALESMGKAVTDPIRSVAEDEAARRPV